MGLEESVGDIENTIGIIASIVTAIIGKCWLLYISISEFKKRRGNNEDIIKGVLKGIMDAINKPEKKKKTAKKK